ncbi:TPR-like protein [Gigaspora margarita]|uniref:TPR-like protein n=1 Tax=Gigaspora margarita TaxID=4874 RepID=A0A8H3X6J3_GIGMA|nr:TPR-like protein [Gigaspora margarita]
MVNIFKANQREKEIDAARCKGNWNAIPELARKFRKHSPDGLVLEQTALAELALVKVIEKTNDEKEFYDNDSPSHISMPPTVDESLVSDVFVKLESALSHASSSGQEKEYTSIVLARTYFSVGRFDQCIQTLSTNFVPPQIPVGYNFVLIIQSLAIKGMTQETFSNYDGADGAIACYDQVVSLLAQYSGERQEQLANWTEEVLYRAPLLKVRLGDVSGALQAFRTYQQYSTSWGENFRLNKRAVIFMNFIKFLSKTYQEKTYVPPSAPTTFTLNEQSNIYTPHTFRVELTELHTLYENVLYQITSFPKAGEINWRVLEMVDQIMSDWVVLNGGTTAEMRGLVEMLYRAAQRTFQSPKILRYLTYTLTTLGDYDEAELALEAYTTLVEKIRETKTVEFFKKIPSTENVYENKFSDNEIVEHVVKVLITGSEMMAKYLCKSDKTLEYAKKALNWCEIDDNLVDDKLFAHAWRCVGVGYSLAAREVIDPENRPDLHSKAIEAFDKSISFDPDAFETHYLLALEYAITRDINKATDCVRQALVLEDESVPCWHLLVLLMSSQKDIQGALKACEMCLTETDIENADSSIDDGEEFLSFKITQNALQEVANGPETAIQNHEKLFILYAKMFPEYALVSPSDPPYDSSSSRKPSNAFEDTQTQTTLSPKPATSVRSFPSVVEKKDGDESTDGSISSIGIGNKDTLEVPKTNYASSIASSRNSASSRRSTTPTISGIPSAKSVTSFITPSQPMLKMRQRKQRATKSLVDLWLSSASTFRRLGNLEEAQKAIESAEETDNFNPDVWCQFGYLLSVQKQYADAITSFHKALAIDGNHVPTLIHLARTYIETDNIDIAEGLLESVTKGNGWDCAEAWLYLGKICQTANRVKRAKDCLWYALDLEETNPVRPFSILPACL